jgi:hypothetical protein
MSGTTIRLIRSTDTGAPVINGSQGSLTAALKAVLQDGFNPRTIQSITRSGSTATVTFTEAHGYNPDGLTKILLAGIDQAEYNGIFEPFNVTTLSVDITVTGSPATPATGASMTAKVAPLGWSEVFSATGKSVFRSNEVTGTRLYLRVDDTGAATTDSYRSALIRGYETMTDVDTGTGPFPTVAQSANGLYVTKSFTLDATPRNWIIIGDGFEFFLLLAHGYSSTANVYTAYHFGDPASEMASDPFGCLIYGLPSSNYNGWPDATTSAILNNFGQQAGHFMARSYTQTGGAITVGKQGNYTAGGNNIGGTGAIGYPAPLNNGIYHSPVTVHESATGAIRAFLKGIYQPLHVRPLGNGGLLPANLSPIGRRLFAVATPYSSSTAGESHFDIDGPWR